jgi:tRNA (guanine37-N1)-methyltransferase
MIFHVVTLFPGAFDSYLGESILKRAIEDKKIKVKFYNPRDFADDKWQRVDQKPYGGGPGMVIQALPVAKAIEKAKQSAEKTKGFKKGSIKIIFFNPSGVQFDTAYAKASAKKLAKGGHMIFVCGRYEGIDARVKKMFRMEDVSVGPFVLTGGELPAMIMMDSISRQIEGVLGNFDSREEERVSSPDSYTRPEIVTYKKKNYAVPKVLLSGNTKLINEWKLGTKGE